MRTARFVCNIMLGSRNAIALVAIGLACVSLAVALPPHPRIRPRPHPAPRISYASIKLVLDKNCVVCHSGAHPKHSLDLSSYASLMKGDREGKVVIAGNPANSRLSKALHRHGAAPMPPSKALPAADTARVDVWIKSGAKAK